MILIALTGPIGSGKDTIADYLVANYGFVKRGFATALREEVAAGYDLGPDLSWYEDRENKERPLLRLALKECADPDFIDAACPMVGMSGPRRVFELGDRRSYRWVLQRWGTEYRRTQCPTYWTDRMAAFFKGKERVVITDTRFPNEQDFVYEHGGALWHVSRSGAGGGGGHQSEAGLPFRPRDHCVVNDGSIADLKNVVALLAPRRQTVDYHPV